MFKKMFNRLFPGTHKDLKKKNKKNITGALSLGCNFASCGIIGVFIDSRDGHFIPIIWALLVVFVVAIGVTINQAKLARPLFKDYCKWGKKCHIIMIIFPFVLLFVWGLKFLIPKVLKNYCASQK